MLLNVSKVDVWRVVIDDHHGALSEKLRAMASAGADLDMIITRRSNQDPTKAVAFVTPIKGAAQEKAAIENGFVRDEHVKTVRIEGPDQPGVAYLITRAVAAEGINIRGVSACRMGHQFIIHMSFDRTEDADKVMKRLEREI